MANAYLIAIIILCALMFAFVAVVTIFHPGDNTGLIATVSSFVAPVLAALLAGMLHGNNKDATGKLEVVNDNLNLNTAVSAKALAVVSPTPENKSLAVAAEKVVSETGTASDCTNTNSEV
jgi:hypothetical protein